MEPRSLRYRDYAPPRREEWFADLSMVENPLGPSRKAATAIAENSTRVNRYAPMSEQSTRAIAEWNGVSEQNVLMTDGADGALTLAFLALVRSGDRVAVPLPTFPRFHYYCGLAGARLVPFRLTDGFELREDELLASGCEVLALCTPNNPTGIPVDVKLVEKALGAYKLVIVDEALLCFGRGAASLERNHENLVVARSFSKLFGLAGMRIGYAMAHPKLISKLSDVSSPFKVSSLAQVAALETLRDTKYIRDSRSHVRKELDRLRKIRRSGTVGRSETLCYLLSLEKGDLDALKKNGVLVTGGEHFDNLNQGFARISLGTREQNSMLLSLLK